MDTIISPSKFHNSIGNRWGDQVHVSKGMDITDTELKLMLGHVDEYKVTKIKSANLDVFL